MPEILAELATVEMHAIQTSGNCVRNITTDHFAGVAADEIVDSYVSCELVRQWSTFSPEFSWLPRKFKIAINGAAADRAATWVHDIGLHALRGNRLVLIAAAEFWDGLFALPGQHHYFALFAWCATFGGFALLVVYLLMSLGALAKLGQQPKPVGVAIAAIVGNSRCAPSNASTRSPSAAASPLSAVRAADTVIC